MSIIKTVITIVLFGLCISTMAADTFIIKYKLNKFQKAFLSSLSFGDIDAEEASKKIREKPLEKLGSPVVSVEV